MQRRRAPLAPTTATAVNEVRPQPTRQRACHLPSVRACVRAEATASPLEVAAMRGSGSRGRAGAEEGGGEEGDDAQYRCGAVRCRAGSHEVMARATIRPKSMPSRSSLVS